MRISPRRVRRERDQSWHVRSGQIRGQASKDPHTRVAHDNPAGSARSDDLALHAYCGIPPGGPAHLESLYVPAFAPLALGMPNLTEANLERHFLVSIIVHIETERVQALPVEGIRRLGSCVRVYRDRHDRGTRLAAEKIEVTDVEPRVFAGTLAVKATVFFASTARVRFRRMNSGRPMCGRRAVCGSRAHLRITPRVFATPSRHGGSVDEPAVLGVIEAVRGGASTAHSDRVPHCCRLRHLERDCGGLSTIRGTEPARFGRGLRPVSG